MNKLYSVHDHWTDINKKNDVDIESIDGVITGIKVNGKDYGGGSSDFSTAQVTLSAKKGLNYVPIVSIYNNELHQRVPTLIESFEAVLYKGSQVCDASEIPGTITVSGDAVFDSNENTITITGDCTITISQAEIG